jgi:hypothetical protein
MIPNKNKLLVIILFSVERKRHCSCVGVSIQRGEPSKTAYHVRMLVLEKISRHFCETTIVLAGISKNKKYLGAAANFGAGGDANLIHFFIWP